MDSAVLGLAPLGCGWCGVRVSPWILHSRVLLNHTMLCDVISAMAEFMVRVLHSRMLLNRTTVGLMFTHV
jgi:hypothetical protein